MCSFKILNQVLQYYSASLDTRYHIMDSHHHIADTRDLSWTSKSIYLTFLCSPTISAETKTILIIANIKFVVLDIVWIQFIITLLMKLLNYFPENCVSSSKNIKKSVKKNLTHFYNHISIQIIHLIFEKKI